MADPVLLRELEDLALRAYDAGQETLAGCLHMLIHASEQMQIDGLFTTMASFNRASLEVKQQEEIES